MRLTNRLLLTAIVGYTTALGHAAFGQNDNPTGPTGVFNGNSNTGCSYDPYTGNATRTIVDLAPSGPVGTYPLQWSRTMNSRGVESTFGLAGGWRHSYLWELGIGGPSTDSPSTPAAYVVQYPDGRSIGFTKATGDSFYHGPLGVSDRMQSVAGSGYVYLMMADGGKVRFSQQATWDPDFARWEFTAGGPDQITDPYGLITTLTYDASGRLIQVTEPAGRWLYVDYRASDGFIDSVHAGYTISGANTETQSVTYVYGTFNGYTVLTGANYSDGGDYSPAGDSATYSYQASNNTGSSAYPLILTCNDTHYAGPMKRIAYGFVAGGLYGQLQTEQYWSGALDSTGRPVLSGINVVTYNLATHTETRGDGPSRTWSYGQTNQPYSVPKPYLLGSFTDFRVISTYQGYDANAFINTIKDRNGHVTTISHVANTGVVTTVTHPPDAAGNPSTIQYFYADASGYYLDHVTDELTHTTYYRRDASHRVTRIDYPDTGYETFSNFNIFNQAQTHLMTSGGTETFGYNTRGLLTNYTPPATPSDGNPGAHPTTYAYDSNDHLQYVTDPKGNRTTVYHNQRGQVTIVQHPIVPAAQGGSGADLSGAMVGWVYNNDGTLQYTNDENTHSTRYTYDDYKRVLTVKDPTNNVTALTYTPTNSGSTSPYSQTANTPRTTQAPLGTMHSFWYDQNLHVTRSTVDAWGADQTTTSYGYDNAGNLTGSTDQNNNLTTFAYDQRNRRITKTDPAPFNGQVTTWTYDLARNLRFEKRPDLADREWQYDSMNRVIQTYGFANEGTHYVRDTAGNVTSMTDPNTHVYSFAYDDLNRKTSATYPVDAFGVNRTETWTYDIAGNLYQYKNQAAQVKTFIYDQRNRAISSSWSTNGPSVATDYDAANRINSITTNGGETIVGFGYDNANRKTSETQTVAGYAAHTVQTPRDADGNRTNLTCGTYSINFDFNGRNQLSHIKNSANGDWFTYGYDANGNLAGRDTIYNGVTTSLNVIDSVNSNYGSHPYDQLNRPMMWENTYSAAALSRSFFDYDSNNRIVDTYRSEDGNKGERYQYDTFDQLQTVWYNASNVNTTTPTGWTRKVTYTNNALNRLNVNDNGTTLGYTADAVNQYTVWGGQSPAYDTNLNVASLSGWNYTYDAEKHLTQAALTQPHWTFTYDGLGRMLKRAQDGVVTIITYDGWKPIVEWDASGNRTAYNVYGAGPDEILWRWVSGVGYLRYAHDRMGNVAFLLDVNGTPLEKYTYDAFGKPSAVKWNTTSGVWNDPSTATGGSSYGNPFLFQGRFWYGSLGLYDFRNRWYQPDIGRFLQPDPLGFGGGDNNHFRYCGGDPVNGSDPFGTQDAEAKNGGWGDDPFEGEYKNMWADSLNPFIKGFDDFVSAVTPLKGDVIPMIPYNDPLRIPWANNPYPPATPPPIKPPRPIPMPPPYVPPPTSDNRDANGNKVAPSDSGQGDSASSGRAPADNPFDFGPSGIQINDWITIDVGYPGTGRVLLGADSTDFVQNHPNGG